MGALVTASSLESIIWQIVSLIPAGKVASYGQVARLAGYPNHARYVGTTLKHLPSGSRLPWHRVVTASGKLAFPPGSPQYQRQRLLLEQEGVRFHGAHLRLKDVRWQASA